MTDTAVTPFPGVTTRPDTTMWWFVLRAPTDLLHRFDAKPWAVRCSLKTRDLRQANDKARALHADWALRFAEMRRQDNPERVALNPALVTAIAAELRRWILQADDNMRDFPGMPDALLKLERRKLIAAGLAAPEHVGLMIPVDPVYDPLAGLNEDQRGVVARHNARFLEEAAVAMAKRDRLYMLPWAELVTKHMGLSIDWKTPEGSDALMVLLKAYRVATAEVVRRDSGEVIETPADLQPQQAVQKPPQQVEGVKATHTPMEAYEAWKIIDPSRPRKSFTTYLAATSKLASMLPGRTIESMTREDARNVVGTLLAQAMARGGKSKNTAANLLGRFKTLLAVAVDSGWITVNPFQGRKIARSKRSRQPWLDSDLIRLFDDPLFNAYALPSASMAGKDAAYWLPLLGLYTGARISELAQLHTDDVKFTEEAGWVVSIEEDPDEGQEVKNEHSIRELPVHPELIRLGFSDYVNAIKGQGPGPLWPGIVRTELNGAGGKISQWFGRYKGDKGFGPNYVFHSFRHTLETRLRAMSVPQYQINALAGHAPGDVSDDYDHPTTASLRPVLERLRFPGLVLPRVFTSPGWKPLT